MPQAGKKPAAKRSKGAKPAARKGAKRSTKPAAKKSAKTPPRKGTARRVKRSGRGNSASVPSSYFFWVFAVPLANLRQSGVALASANRGTPPIKQPLGGATLIGRDCKVNPGGPGDPPLQFIQK